MLDKQFEKQPQGVCSIDIRPMRYALEGNSMSAHDASQTANMALSLGQHEHDVTCLDVDPSAPKMPKCNAAILECGKQFSAVCATQ